VDLRSFSSAVRSASHIGVTTRASKYYDINQIWKVITIIGLDYIRLHTTTDQSIQTFQKIEGKVSKTAKHKHSPAQNSAQKSGNCDGHS
jgi:hypothetical protein